MTVDYKSTVFLPRTDFPMRAGLPRREPEILARWREMDIFARLREEAKGREKFILHDGPPYANGHLHIGHALNKILKDVINRSQQMLGKDAVYVPGWDCHGLPIEWKIEESYRAKGQDKDEVPPVEFRRECRDFAEKWIGIQSEEFQRLGVFGDWDRPYTTMTFAAEATIAAELMKFAETGQLYRGSKPVMWSVVEKTALAEAEVEYADHTSDTIWARFPIVHFGSEAAREALDGADVVIWTTTPWTIPGNRAICFSSRIGYGLYRVTAAAADNWTREGALVVLADALAEAVMKQARVEGYERLREVPGELLDGLRCAHPLGGQGLGGHGYDFEVPLFDGDHVTDDAGTGFVHTAPGHGADDFEIWVANEVALKNAGIDHRIPYTVDADGSFTRDAPGFEGKVVITDEGEKGDANQAVIDALAASGRLMARGRLKHSYPHSWRSKKPVIFRNTPQWFISMGDEHGDKGLRATALRAIDETRFVPASGQVRLRSMIEQRPDWVISRQRAWGVPIAVFVRKSDGEILVDAEVNRRIGEAFEAEGADAWFDEGAKARFLGNAYEPDEWEKVDDILDVWFDSGSTHSFVLEQRDDLQWPASLYLEGSDQHRGWFHSSLLESCGTRGRAPYDAVLTHGFVLDEKGHKMSKSMGNVVAPQDVIDQSGADILRLWVVASDYADDVRIGPEILKYQADAYRRLRNTLRYLLGALSDFDPAERVAPAEMPELERWVLHRMAEIDGVVRRSCETFDFHTMFRALHDFCAVDLSAFYFDIRKDAVYCDRPDAPRRRAARTVLDLLFDHLTAWLAPIICFTAEEAWWERGPREVGGGKDGAPESVHLRLFPEVPADWRDEALGARWAKVRELRRVVTGALEVERAEKRIGASTQAHPTVHVERDDLLAAVEGLDMAEIAITSGLTLVRGGAPEGAFALEDVAGVGVVAGLAEGERCERCWRVLPEVGSVAAAPQTCARCADAVEHLGVAAQ